MNQLKNISIFFIIGLIFPVNIIVEPYLQNATPTSIYILWETDSFDDTIVEWESMFF